MKSRLAIKFPTLYEWRSNSLPPRQEKASNARGMPGGGGMLKLQFDWYIRIKKFPKTLWGARLIESGKSAISLCGLTLLLFLALFQGFPSGYSSFPHSLKTSSSKFQFNQEPKWKLVWAEFCGTHFKKYCFIWLALWVGKMNQIVHCVWIPKRARWSYILLAQDYLLYPARKTSPKVI